MSKFILAAQRFIHDEEGVTTIEYVMLAASVVIVLAAVLTPAVGTALKDKLTAIIAMIDTTP